MFQPVHRSTDRSPVLDFPGPVTVHRVLAERDKKRSGLFRLPVPPIRRDRRCRRDESFRNTRSGPGTDLIIHPRRSGCLQALAGSCPARLIGSFRAAPGGD